MVQRVFLFSLALLPFGGYPGSEEASGTNQSSANIGTPQLREIGFQVDVS